MSVASNEQAWLNTLSGLLTYANGVTGESDTNIGDAVRTLADGYGQGGSSDWVYIPVTVTPNKYYSSDGIECPYNGWSLTDPISTDGYRFIACFTNGFGGSYFRLFKNGSQQSSNCYTMNNNKGYALFDCDLIDELGVSTLTIKLNGVKFYGLLR